MGNGKYNGWTNYETWKVNLEFFDGNDNEGYDAEAAQQMVEDYLDELCEDNWCRSLAYSFISEVNWHEIVDSHKDDNK